MEVSTAPLFFWLDMADLTDDIETLAGKAKASAKGDASLTRHSIQDLIAADQYLKQVDAGEQHNLGLRSRAQKPPGAWA